LSLVIRLQPTPESIRVIEEHAARPRNLMRALSSSLRQALAEVETHIKVNYLRGGHHSEKRDGKPPLASRTGSLLQAVTHDMESQLSGYVGTAEGVTTPYARAQLGDQDTVIRPKNAKWLWQPIADNLTGKGVARLTPTQAVEDGAYFVKSKTNDKIYVMTTAKVPGVRRKDGATKLLFVLHKSVTVKGTNALAKGVEDKRGRIEALLQQGLIRGLTTEPTTGGDA
jgi:hypothetical protein